MNLQERIALYKEFEEKRKRPLITYLTSQRPGASGGMAGDVVNELIDQIQAIPKEAENIDFLIESLGGDGLTAWQIMSLLRSKFKKITVIIPHSAFSAATMLALGGDEIMIGQYGFLGPIDPQITVVNKDGTRKNFAYEDIVSFFEFARKDAGLTEQGHIEEAFKILCGTVEPATLGMSKRASSLAVTIGEKLLKMHMQGAEGRIKAKDIAEKLNKSFFSHGHALNRSEAEDIGLEVVKPDEKEEEIIWKIHQSFEKELNSRTPYDPISEFLNEEGAQAYLSSTPPLSLPQQINPQLVQQILMDNLQNQLKTVTPDVTRELKVAFMESVRLASEFYIKHKILVSRNLDMNFIGSAVQLGTGWRDMVLPKS